MPGEVTPLPWRLHCCICPSPAWTVQFGYAVCKGHLMVRNDYLYLLELERYQKGQRATI